MATLVHDQMVNARSIGCYSFIHATHVSIGFAVDSMEREAAGLVIDRNGGYRSFDLKYSESCRANDADQPRRRYHSITSKQ